MQNRQKAIWAVIIFILLAVVLSLPPISIWSRVTYHARVLYREVKYWLQPPSEAVFVPSTDGNGLTTTPVSAILPTNTPVPPPTAVPTDGGTPSEGGTPSTTSSEFNLGASPTPLLTTTPVTDPALTPTSIPMPTSILLTGMLPERQFMNNCGPATLSVYLSYYHWGKDQLTTGVGIRPNDVDVNTMPYELVDFVNGNTEWRALWRYGADLNTLKALLNAGLPVMIERGFEPYSLRSEGWVGHFNLVVGYDDDRQTLTVHDSYLMSYPPWGGGEIPVETWGTFIGFDFTYSELEQTWRAFNNAIIVVYPPDKESEVLTALGPLATEADAARIAYERAMQETVSLTNIRDRYFAWFNAGTSLVVLEDYTAAATAFDTAFEIYPTIELDARPYRMLWYQTGPYPAYYYSGRYQDVINLANQTLSYMADPVLEESYYWRALSYHALGDTTSARADLRTCLEYHPGFTPCMTTLDQLSGNP